MNRSVRGNATTNSRSRKRRRRSVFLATRFNVVSPNDDDDFRSRSSIQGKDWPRSRSKAEGSTRLDNFSPVESLSSARNSHDVRGGRRTIKETEVRNYPVRRVERGLRLIRVKSVSWFRSCYLPIHRSISYFSTEFFEDFSRAKIEFVAQFFSFFFFFAIHDSIKI